MIHNKMIFRQLIVQFKKMLTLQRIMMNDMIVGMVYWSM